MTSSSALREGAEAIADAQEPVGLTGLALLRTPFPTAQVGKLPKPYRSDSQKGTCDECGKWHGLPAMHLDFVGHGAVTNRLLDVDPAWSWEPFAVGPDDLPALDRHGNLWIRLTVLGVTRIGVGDGASMKVLIGDAIRNAAMRFGVALDLWMRGSEDEKQTDSEKLTDPPEPSAEALARKAVGERIKTLPDDQREAVKDWLDASSLTRIPQDWNDDDLADVTAFLDGLSDDGKTESNRDGVTE